MNLYIVTGYPRSGTSLTGAILDTLGIPMGYWCQPGDEFNPLGYFEDGPFMGTISGTIAQTGLRPLTDAEFPEDARSHLRSTLMQYRERGVDFGFKNNHVAYAADTLLTVLPADMQPHLIVCKRTKEHSLASQRKRLTALEQEIPPTQHDDYDRLYAAIGMLSYKVQDRGGQVLYVQYERTLDYPEHTVGQIAQFVRCEDQGRIRKAAGLVNPIHDHSREVR
jgi:hypothetical protein